MALIPDKTMAVNLTHFAGTNYFLGTFDIDNYQRWWKSETLPVREIKMAMSSFGAINHVALTILDNGDWGIFRSTDFGQTWSLVHQSQDEIYYIFKIEEGWLLFNASDGFYESVNGGVTWMKITDLPPALTNKIAMCEAGWSDVYDDPTQEPIDRVYTTFFVTDGQSVWRSQDLCRTWVKVLEIEWQFESNIVAPSGGIVGSKPASGDGVNHNSSGFGPTDPFPFDAASNPAAIAGYNGIVLVGAGRYIVWSSDGGLTWARLDKHSRSAGDAITNDQWGRALFGRTEYKPRGTLHEHDYGNNYGKESKTQHWNVWMPDWPEVGFTDFPNPTYMPWDFRIIEIKLASAQIMVRYPFDICFLVKTTDMGHSDQSVANFLKQVITITDPNGATEIIHFNDISRFYSTPANYVRVDTIRQSTRLVPKTVKTGGTGWTESTTTTIYVEEAYTATYRQYLTLVWDRAPNSGECRIFTGSDNEKPYIQFSQDDIGDWLPTLKAAIHINIAINPINLKNRIFVTRDLSTGFSYEFDYSRIGRAGWDERITLPDQSWYIYHHPAEYQRVLLSQPHFMARGWALSKESTYYKFGMDLAVQSSSLPAAYGYGSAAESKITYDLDGKLITLPPPMWWQWNWLFFNVLNASATEGFASFAINESLVTGSNQISNIMFAALNEYIPDPDGMGGTVTQKLMYSSDGGITWKRAYISDLSLYPGAAAALDAAANDIVATEAEKANAAVIFKSEAFGSTSWNGNYCANAWKFKLDHFHRFFSFDIKPWFGPKIKPFSKNIDTILGLHKEFSSDLDAFIARFEQYPFEIGAGLLGRPKRIFGLRTINLEHLLQSFDLGGICESRPDEPFEIRALCSGRVKKGIMISSNAETRVYFPIDINVNLVQSHIDELVVEMESIIPQWWDQIGPRRPFKPYDSKLVKK